MYQVYIFGTAVCRPATAWMSPRSGWAGAAAGARQEGAERAVQDAAHRPQLPRHHQARCGGWFRGSRGAGGSHTGQGRVFVFEGTVRGALAKWCARRRHRNTLSPACAYTAPALPCPPQGSAKLASCPATSTRPARLASCRGRVRPASSLPAAAVGAWTACQPASQLVELSTCVAHSTHRPLGTWTPPPPPTPTHPHTQARSPTRPCSKRPTRAWGKALWWASVGTPSTVRCADAGAALCICICCSHTLLPITLPSPPPTPPPPPPHPRPAAGTNFVDCLERFVRDPQTEGIIMIGACGSALAPRPTPSPTHPAGHRAPPWVALAPVVPCLLPALCGSASASHPFDACLMVSDCLPAPAVQARLAAPPRRRPQSSSGPAAPPSPWSASLRGSPLRPAAAWATPAPSSQVWVVPVCRGGEASNAALLLLHYGAWCAPRHRHHHQSCPAHSHTHAGGKGTAQDKIKALEAAGVTVTPSPAQMGAVMKRVMVERGLA